jgi:hypothetical protein
MWLVQPFSLVCAFGLGGRLINDDAWWLVQNGLSAEEFEAKKKKYRQKILEQIKYQLFEQMDEKVNE